MKELYKNIKVLNYRVLQEEVCGIADCYWIASAHLNIEYGDEWWKGQVGYLMETADAFANFFGWKQLRSDLLFIFLKLGDLG